MDRRAPHPPPRSTVCVRKASFLLVRREQLLVPHAVARRAPRRLARARDGLVEAREPLRRARAHVGGPAGLFARQQAAQLFDRAFVDAGRPLELLLRFDEQRIHGRGRGVERRHGHDRGTHGRRAARVPTYEDDDGGDGRAHERAQAERRPAEPPPSETFLPRERALDSRPQRRRRLGRLEAAGRARQGGQLGGPPRARGASLEVQPHRLRLGRRQVSVEERRQPRQRKRRRLAGHARARIVALEQRQARSRSSAAVMPCPASTSRSRARALCSCDFDVPTWHPSIAATSSCSRPSTSCRTITVR